MFSISNNLQRVRREIEEHEKHYKRNVGSVTLLAVSKTKPVEAVTEAIAAGQVHFGENYLDDALIKINAIQNESCVWHFIGHIQSNKTKSIAKHFDWVHTLDREKIAQRLSMQRPEGLPALNCLVQLNIDNETNKSGVAETELAEFLERIGKLPGIYVRGLMVIPAIRETLAEQRDVFARVRTIFVSMRENYPAFDTLSMGMSADMEAAIAEGATMVRIGTAIFGIRD